MTLIGFSSEQNCQVIHGPPTEPPTRWALILLIRSFSSLTSARNASGPTHPCVGLQPIPSPFKSLELLFFAASKNITPWFFQVSSKSGYLNRPSFFNGYQKRLVRYRHSLNYSYVCKERILKLSNEIQTSEQQLTCCSGPFGGLHGPQSLGRREPHRVCVPEPSWKPSACHHQLPAGQRGSELPVMPFQSVPVL